MKRPPLPPHAERHGADESGCASPGSRAYASRRVLGIFPHPDDEAYAAGGLLAHCADGGAAVEVLCATRGEHGRDRSGVTASGPALAALRTRELAASCQALGVAPPAFLDLPDGALTACQDVGVHAVSRHLHRLRPHLVVTLGRDGVYASFDHLAWTEVVSTATQTLVPAPRLLHAVFPRRLFAPLWRALRRHRGAPLVADIDPELLGVEAHAAALRLDIRAVRDRKLAALAAHRSQLSGGDPLTFLRRGVVARLLDEEWYVVAHGPSVPAGSADPFAGM